MKKYSVHIFLFLLIFTSSLCQAQWIQQTVPITSEASSLVFFDANTGLISLGQRYVLRTTNSGFNWSVIAGLTGVRIYGSGMQKIDSTTVYALGDTYSTGYSAIYRTFDRGLTWDSVSKQNSLAISSIYFIDRDTGWYSAFAIPSYTIWKTTNGGVSMFQVSVTGGAYGNMFFLKEKVNGQYWGWVAADGIYRTMNGGVNWYNTANLSSSGQIYFLNKDTGWVSDVYTSSTNPADIYVTYNGGQNWIRQTLPNGSNFAISSVYSFKVVNKNILYGVGGALDINHQRILPIIWKTTNGGNNWGYQSPDTSVHANPFKVVDFINENIGWVYTGTIGLMTLNGGGPIIYTKINNDFQNISMNYKLYQNYPNPFNSISIIKYKMEKTTSIKIIVFDIAGKEIAVLVNEKKKAGEYEVTFNAVSLSSGIYYYALYADGVRVRVGAKKMVLLK